MERIQIAGLGEALRHAATIDTPRLVTVVSITVRHSQALLELLEQKTQQHGWSVDLGRMKRLRMLSRLDNELTVIAEVLIPHLSEQDAEDADAARALSSYGLSVARLARSIGGPFSEVASPVGQLLRRHALDADWLVNNVKEEVLGKVLTLKDVVVDFPDDDGDDAEEGDEE